MNLRSDNSSAAGQLPTAAAAACSAPTAIAYPVCPAGAAGRGPAGVHRLSRAFTGVGRGRDRGTRLQRGTDLVERFVEIPAGSAVGEQAGSWSSG
jgi:hypothetical protein